jgi:hypothetical protein
MVAGRTLSRAALVVLMAAAPAVWYACSSDGPSAPPPEPVNPRIPVADLRAAIAAQRRHTDALLLTPGVIGTAVAPLEGGGAGMLILLERPGIPGLPQVLDGVPVKVQVTGRIMALSDPTQRQRPASLGFSVGHPNITAGTIGARVRDALGRVYILSNNHVLSNQNDATVGDPEYQPGPFDGGSAADQIATLSDFQLINFTGGNNTMDAAIALSSVTVLDNATPSDDGYGMPNATIYGDADGDGMFDTRDGLLGLNVQKYGRTTRLTHGQITGVNATVTVCYEVVAFQCTKTARYVDQLIISPGGFSGGGDSGSLIVTDDANLNPVALLFAGSSTVTIGNRIDLVLNRFGVTIDGSEPPPPGPLTDVSVTSVSGPSAAVQGHASSIVVMVKNVGNQNVSAFDVTLQDTTEHVTVATQSVAALTAGASSTLTFVWTPSTTGDHNLVASQSLADDRATNDQRSTTIPVNAPFTDVAVASFTTPVNGVTVGHTVNIGVTVTNEGNLSTGSFVVTLRDTTAGAGIGTQTVSTLAPGAGANLIFSWNTTGAALGPHTLVATHNLADDDATDDRLTTAVTVRPKPTDIATTAITGPRSVAQGDTAHVVVTVQNVGEVNVTAPFAVELTDGTAGGGVIGTQTVAGLAIGATATVDIPWNTAGAAITGHIVIATQKLPDDKWTNDAMAIAITVNAPVPPPPSTDIAVSSLNAPGSISQGSSTSIGVTVQNVGVQNVSASFNVVLTDQTAGTTIGTQTVTGLAAGASAIRNFTWTTTNAVLGSHTLVATQSFADDNAANNQRSATVSVAPQPTDIAVTAITAPPRVNQGEVAPVTVTIQNVGGQEVTTGIDVVLTDGWNGPILGTQTISGLAVGATATRTFTWNTTGAAITGHTLFATQKLADNNPANNSIGIGINVQTPPTTDIAVSGVTAPASVAQGTTAAIAVAVQNVGGLNVTSSFDIVLTDATAGVTISTQTIPGLPASSNTSRTFNWNTTAAALGGHTLVATLTLSDANAANNQGSVTVTLNAPSTDVAVTALTAPGTVLKGSSATIGVTVQNVGGVNVGTSFNVVLTDQTAGVTIGTQAVTSLAVGASTTRSFSWNTASAALGGHTLVATQTLTDDNAGNNQRSATVTVNPAPADIALASIAAPGSVTQGDTAAIVVIVQNVGGQDVTANFDVVLTDGTAGNAVLGTQTIPGLALGASVTRTFNWNTGGGGAAQGGHILTATQKYPDGNSSNNAKATVVSVNAPSLHVGNLGGVADTSGTTGTWSATVQITAHDNRHSPLNGVTVHGLWNGTGSDITCVTSDAGGTGTCTVVLSSIPNATRMVSFGVTGLTLTGYTYKPSGNHDPDGSSNGYSVTVKRQP